VLIFTGVALSGRPGARQEGTQTPTPKGTSTPTVAGSATATAPHSPLPPQFHSVGANQYSCDSASHSHSVTGGSRVLFSFVNDSQLNLRIIWLNYAGARVNERLLSPGGMYSVNTFIGYDWMVANHSSDCLAIFTVTGPGSVTLAP